MTTKLTLTIDDDVINRAKRYARGTGTSVSQLVEQYLQNLTAQDSNSSLPSGLDKIIGSVQVPEGFDEKTELLKYLEDKHL